MHIAMSDQLYFGRPRAPICACVESVDATELCIDDIADSCICRLGWRIHGDTHGRAGVQTSISVWNKGITAHGPTCAPSDSTPAHLRSGGSLRYPDGLRVQVVGVHLRPDALLQFRLLSAQQAVVHVHLAQAALVL